MKNFLFGSLFIAFILYVMYINDLNYKKEKRTYYDCKSEEIKLYPLTPHQYATLLESKSLEDFTCTKSMYTRYYVNLLKEKKKR